MSECGILLKVATASRNMSEALHVVTGIKPIDQQLQEKKRVYDESYVRVVDSEEGRVKTIEEWQER